MSSLRILLICPLLSIMLSGCAPTPEGKGESPEQLNLREVAEVYRSYSLDHGNPPQDLKQIATLRPVGPGGIQALEAGDIVLNYGAAMTDTNEGLAATSSDKVLAYEKKVPESGGLVLMLDRTVKTMTADEFKVAHKAGK